MRSHLITASVGAFVSTGYSLQIPSYAHCPPLGPVLPAPTNPSQNAAVQAAASTVEAQFGAVVSQLLNNTYTSIRLTSIHEDVPLLDLNWKSPTPGPNSTSQVDHNTVYRIGSVSKVYVVLALLQLSDKIRWDDPVTRYVPELLDIYGSGDKSAMTAVDWEEVTIEALASQMGGIPGNFGFDMGNDPVNWTEYGLPTLNSSEVSGCGGWPGEAGCTQQTFFAKYGQRHPVYAPWTTPAYSNIGFAILGMVIESVTNQSYVDYIQKAIIEPLNLSRTGFSAPTDSNLVDAPWFGTDLGIENPSGGVYSTTADLLTFASAILNSTFLTPAQTRRWLKPRSHTASLGVSVGAPWEIGRAVGVTADNRTIDIYTKSGEVGEYYGNLALIPDYDLAMSVLSAGPDGSALGVYAAMTEILKAMLPAVEQAGKEQANSTFAGLYQLPCSSNTNITISVDSDGPGLKITDWYTEGQSMAENWPALSFPAGEPMPSPEPAPGVGIRLYPTNLKAGNTLSWRAVFDSVPSAAAAEQYDSMLFFPQGTCTSWSDTDNVLYGLNGMDDFVFEIDATTGRASSVTHRGLRQTLVRVV